MSAYGIERCIGVALVIGVVVWISTVGLLAWRDERRARWRREEAEADEFVRSLREHPAGHAIVVPPSPTERRCAVLERRAAWLRRRVAERPEASSFDRRELDALEWALGQLRSPHRTAGAR